MRNKVFLIINILFMCLYFKYNAVYGVTLTSLKNQDFHNYQNINDDLANNVSTHSTHTEHNEPFEHTIGHCHGCIIFALVSSPISITEKYFYSSSYSVNNSNDYNYNPYFSIKKPPKA